MIVIANNLTTRNRKINQVFREAQTTGWNPDQVPADILKEYARQSVAAGADVLEINIQQHFDQPEAMVFAVRAIQQITDQSLCLSTNNPEALEAGLAVCKRPPLVNYISVDDIRLNKMLPLVAEKGASVVLLVSDPAAPCDAREMLFKASILIGALNEAGIPNDNIIIDPGLIHIAGELGQRHLVEVIEFLRAIHATETTIRSTCWLGNIAAGIPRRLRPVLETALFPMLIGLGLSSVFMDVSRRENMRIVRLTRIFHNESVYADSDVEL